MNQRPDSSNFHAAWSFFLGGRHRVPAFSIFDPHIGHVDDPTDFAVNRHGTHTSVTRLVTVLFTCPPLRVRGSSSAFAAVHVTVPYARPSAVHSSLMDLMDRVGLMGRAEPIRTVP